MTECITYENDMVILGEYKEKNYRNDARFGLQMWSIRSTNKKRLKKYCDGEKHVTIFRTRSSSREWDDQKRKE